MQPDTAMSPALQPYLMHIGGTWVPASDGETFESVDPYTGNRRDSQR